MERANLWVLSAALVTVIIGAVPAHALRVSDGSCTVTFRLAGTREFTSLQYDVLYSGEDGTFIRGDTGLDCQPLVSDVSVLGHDRCQNGDAVCSGRNSRILTTVVVTPDSRALNGSVDFVRCTFAGNASTTPGDFVVLTRSAVEADRGKVRSSLPSVEMSSFDCTENIVPAVDTKSSGAYFSLPLVDAPNSRRFLIDVELGDNRRVSALDVSVDYNAAAGQFVAATDGSIACQVAPGLNALTAFNDCRSVEQPGCDTGNVLEAALVTTSGFTGPRELFQCAFDSYSSAPQASDFVVRVNNASLDTADVSVQRVRVSSIRSAGASH